MVDRATGTRQRMNDGDAMAALRVALNGLAQRQRAVANNIANADTPGFKASEVRFEDRLAAALQRRTGGLPLQRTADGHLPAAPERVADVRPAEEIVHSLTYRNDGNNVDVDSEMSKLAETQLRFAAAAQAMNGRLSVLRTIITEGRR
jgi:flagellar basal-body rod protein FlgB